MNKRNIGQRIFLCTLALFVPLFLASLVALSLATAEAGMSTSDVRAARIVVNGITSDDFNTCGLNTGLWTFVTPLSDSSYALVNTFTDDAALEIMVPGGNERHSISESNTNAPRMMQAVSDGSANFMVEAKFDSSISQRFQVQGILVEGTGSDEFIRFEYFSDGLDIHVFGASLSGGILSTHNNITVTAAGPSESYYMRVQRDGNQWIQSYKIATDPWTDLPAFTNSIIVNAIGPYAGNSGNPPTTTVPAHTAIVDYFFNTDSPIDPEDGDRNELTLLASPSAGGNVAKSPDKSSYACNEEVTISATPNEGWDFNNWSGDWSGSTNPDMVTMTGSRQINANFILSNGEENLIMLPIILRNP